MVISMRPTAKIAAYEGVDCRVWKGVTDLGVGCVVFVRAVAVPAGSAQDEFQRELIEQAGPVVHVPLSLVLF